MKTNLILSLFFLLHILSFVAKAQERNEIPVRLEYIFTGEIKNECDSVFSVNLIIDEIYSSNILSVTRKTQKSTNKVPINKVNELNALVLTKDTRIKKKDGEIVIDLGIIDPADGIEEILLEGKNGKHLKTKYLH